MSLLFNLFANSRCVFSLNGRDLSAVTLRAFCRLRGWEANLRVVGLPHLTQGVFDYSFRLSPPSQ